MATELYDKLRLVIGIVRPMAAVTLLVVLPALPARAQSFETLGTRAQGMGAFVAVADDASAVYWNPGGLASGAYFSLVLDRSEGDALPSNEARGGRRSSWLLALSAPAAGVSYYRLRTSAVAPLGPESPGRSRVESLVTHHAGVTLVQSVFHTLAVGATVKLVRGVANAAVSDGAPDVLLEELPLGRATSRFDVDAGAMVSIGRARLGLTVRNLTSPEFDTPEGGALRVDRQARAGLALPITPRWTAAVDLDLTRNRGPFGDVRTLAVGAEGRLTRRAVARAGVQMNTAGENGRDPSASFGASYAAFGSLLVDAHVSTGSDHGFKGWGVAGRVVF